MELIADSLDGQVEEAQYDDPLMRRVIGAIRNDALSPEELARVKDEAAWEDTKRDERDQGRAEGRVEGMREAIADLCEAYGLVLSPAQRAEVAGLDIAGLERLRLHLKQHKVWPA